MKRQLNPEQKTNAGILDDRLRAMTRPMIEIMIPDYDQTFTYSLKLGDLAYFDDNNRLELAQRHQLTDFVAVVNNALIALNRAERDKSALLEALKALLFQSENNFGDCGIYDQARAAIAAATGKE